MSEAKKKTAKPIADVSHPGKSAPSSTSKPVIVTNRPILKDPMMVDEDTTIVPVTVSRTAEPKLEPLSQPAELTA